MRRHLFQIVGFILIIGLMRDVQAKDAPVCQDNLCALREVEDTKVKIQCPANKYLLIKSAYYGVRDKGCNLDGLYIKRVLRHKCDGKTTCDITAKHGFLGSLDPCSEHGPKKLEVDYSCGDKSTPFFFISLYNLGMKWESCKMACERQKLSCDLEQVKKANTPNICSAILKGMQVEKSWRIGQRDLKRYMSFMDQHSDFCKETKPSIKTYWKDPKIQCPTGCTFYEYSPKSCEYDCAHSPYTTSPEVTCEAIPKDQEQRVCACT